MTGKEIRALRESLGLTARTFAAKLDVDPAVVLAWEHEELFPTKRHVQALRALVPPAEPTDGAPPPAEAAVGSTGGASAGGGMEALADPAFWEIFRKLLAYPDLRREVELLAKKHPDPAKAP